MSADLIVLAAIAIFVLLRLRSVLGQKIGHDSTKVKENAADEEARIVHISPKKQDIEETLRNALRRPEVIPEAYKDNVAEIRAVDPNFSLEDFLKGAKAAFEMVVQAFAKDDRETLKQLLSKELFQQFRDSLEARKKDETYEETTLVAILKADVVRMEVKKNIAEITIRFESEQIRVMRDKDKKITEGDPSAIQNADDDWTFERDLRSSNPNWTITST